MKKVGNNENLPCILVILDGWGLAKPSDYNAVYLAKKPTYDHLIKRYPNTSLLASGKDVGLPNGQDGNSEAGHMNIGAGRIAKQDAVIVNEMIKDGSFFKNRALWQALNHAKKYKSNIHLMGLLSNGQSAHSEPRHLYALLKFFADNKFHRIYLHLFTDGRDSSQHAAGRLISKLINNFKNEEIISTIMGRFYAMDRIKKWKRTEIAYNAIVLGQGIASDNPYRAISEAYNREETDEFIAPIVIMNPIKKPKFIDNNDAVIFFNLRSDRARQLAKPFVQKNFEKDNKNSFKRKRVLKNLKFVTMADFGPDLDDIRTISRSYILENTLPLALRNFRQLYLAEREKYAHMTYFFNGGHSAPVNGEKWQVISSLGQKNYEKYPQMSSRQICKIVCRNLKNNSFDFIAINFANADMLAHTSNLKATIKSVEIIDSCLACIYKSIMMLNGTLIITADHGNAEELINLETGEIDTEHSTNPVPLILVNKKFNKKNIKLKKGRLADIAPTVLQILNVKKPKEMTGRSLILK